MEFKMIFSSLSSFRSESGSKSPTWLKLLQSFEVSPSRPFPSVIFLAGTSHSRNAARHGISKLH